MPKVTITAAFVRKAHCPSGRTKIDFFDERMTGFMIEVRSSGRKTFYLRYTDKRGRERQLKIGRADILSVDGAKRKARDLLAAAIIGYDPTQQRKDIKKVPTFSQFARERYLPYVKGYKRSWKSDEIHLRLHIVPSIGSLYLDEIRDDHVTNVLRSMRLNDYSAATRNRILVVVRYAFNLAIIWKIVGVSSNPTKGIPLAPERRKERFLSKSETERLLATLESYSNKIVGKIVLLLLLTGARRSEIVLARWEHVDLERRTILVPISKSGKPRTITLNEAAVDLLRSLERDPGNPFVFPWPRTGCPTTSLSYYWDRIRHAAGLPDLRLHDLRHSFASFLVNDGVSIYAVQKLLGHSQISTTQRYAHLEQETLRDAAETAGRFVKDAVTTVSNRSSGSLSVSSARLDGMHQEA